ncbi:MAG: hypothetical protein M1838_004436 [Thelocarpon superellum]|nr:MAG: hypothetical protein M1838_004436 [Thelocarpon superellum]
MASGATVLRKNEELMTMAFPDNPQLRAAMGGVMERHHDWNPLFIDVARYIINLREKCTRLEQQQQASGGDGAEPAAKKRRLEVVIDGRSASKSLAPVLPPSSTPSLASVILDAGDLSFTIPRKKLRLEFTTDGLVGRSPSFSAATECAVRWEDIEHVVCAPVPEKVQPQHNFCIFPRRTRPSGANGIKDGDGAEPDAIVWTVPESALLPTTATGIEMQQSMINEGITGEPTLRSLLIWLVNKQLRPLGSGKRVVEPSEAEFVSAIVQAHRKDEKAVHVKGFRGSKEGYLYFLPTGILWGFKKPLLFFSFDRINSISYTSVLQRTFNLNIEISHHSTTDTKGGGGGGAAEEEEKDNEELEFSMLDQADFPGIDEYVKRHGLHDASMAEQRRARAVASAHADAGANTSAGANAESGAWSKTTGAMTGNVEGEGGREMGGKGDVAMGGMNGRAGEAGAGGGAFDEEDEEEEDYDPGSEGQSEGSGSSSDDDEAEEEEEEEEEEEGGEEEE